MPWTDKCQDGRPVYIEQLGNIDLAAINKITTGERMLQNLAVEYEKLADPRLPACSRKAGQLLETCCTIMDLKGVGLNRVSSVYAYVKQASALSQNYYPERLGHMYLINAPWGFSSVFSVVKGFLDPVTVKKIHVLGSNYQTELLEQVPTENLPELFGGTCNCLDGCGFSDDGPWKDPKWAKPPKWALEAPKEGEGKKSKAEEAAIENQTGSIVGEGSEAPPPPYTGNPEAAPAPGATNTPDTTTGGSIPTTGTMGAVPALEAVKQQGNAHA
jgi:CRAL/TRIO domain